MKLLLFITAGLFLTQTSLAQLKKTAACPTFSIDLLSGRLNDGLNPASGIGEIKNSFPCYTHLAEQPSGNKCAGIFYTDKDIYFYTDRDYIEIGPNYKGKLSVPLMGASRKNLFSILGYPKIKDTNWDAFQTEYGTLVLYYNKAAKINKIQVSTKSTESIKLCE